MAHNQFNNLKELPRPKGEKTKFYSLPAIEKMGLGKISRLPVCIRIVLESVVRNFDDKKITEAHVRQLAGWKPIFANKGLQKTEKKQYASTGWQISLSTRRNHVAY